ncbi:hypothetical protein GCM10009544_60410 [Streptomyces stramineus]|uniref:Uncharacterized protein n=1 Tax=Streptomyces stramineus TaxID=173861 RepID=A0ABN1B716_9ACTN
MAARSITAPLPMRPRMAKDPVELIPELAEVSAALFKATGNRSVPRATISLMQLRAGRIAGSTYLTVLHAVRRRPRALRRQGARDPDRRDRPGQLLHLDRPHRQARPGPAVHGPVGVRGRLITVGVGWGRGVGGLGWFGRPEGTAETLNGAASRRP